MNNNPWIEQDQTAIAAPVKERIWSPYQRAIFDFVANGEGSVMIRAVAGSGKTTTIVEAIKYVRPGLEVAFLAFGKRIAEELKTRVTSCHVSTFHSLCLANVKAVRRNVNVEVNKTWRILEETYVPNNYRYLSQSKRDEVDELRDMFGQVRSICSLLKLTLRNPTYENALEICDKYSFNLNGNEDEYIRMALQLFEDSIADTRNIDFDDMLWLCATGRVPCRKFDVLFVDECQDLNAAQAAVVINSLKPGGRAICVGDPKQAIMGFAGARNDSMDYLASVLDAGELPLTITYRCPKTHVAYAKQLVDYLECAENAIEGEIINIGDAKLFEYVAPPDMVVCRTNAPLVSPAFSVIRQGVKAVILGRDIGASITGLIKKVVKKYQVEDYGQFFIELVRYGEDEKNRLLAKNKQAQAANLDDQIETIIAFGGNADNIPELIEKVTAIFSDEAQGVTFSTIHKAKGLESENIFILYPELMYPKWGDPDQEPNIDYVARTRSKNKLYLVSKGN